MHAITTTTTTIIIINSSSLCLYVCMFGLKWNEMCWIVQRLFNDQQKKKKYCLMSDWLLLGSNQKHDHGDDYDSTKCSFDHKILKKMQKTKQHQPHNNHTWRWFGWWSHVGHGLFIQQFSVSQTEEVVVLVVMWISLTSMRLLFQNR